jgi:hypothetical protein
MVEQMSGWWGVWCEPADGRRYWLGDASQTRWTQEVAEGVAAYLSRYEIGTFTAKAMPGASKEPDPNAYRRGLITAKGNVHDCTDGSDTYYFTVLGVDDGNEEQIVVDKELCDTTRIAGLGRDAVLVYRDGEEPTVEPVVSETGP